MKKVRVTKTIRPNHKDISRIKRLFGNDLVAIRYYHNTETGERWKTVELLWEGEWKDMSISCQMNPAR